MPQSAKSEVQLDKILEVQEMQSSRSDDDDFAKSSVEFGGVVNNGSDLSMFYEDSDLSSREMFQENFQARYKRDAEHRWQLMLEIGFRLINDFECLWADKKVKRDCDSGFDFVYRNLSIVQIEKFIIRELLLLLSRLSRRSDLFGFQLNEP